LELEHEVPSQRQTDRAKPFKLAIVAVLSWPGLQQRVIAFLVSAFGFMSLIKDRAAAGEELCEFFGMDGLVNWMKAVITILLGSPWILGIFLGRC